VPCADAQFEINLACCSLKQKANLQTASCLGVGACGLANREYNTQSRIGLGLGKQIRTWKNNITYSLQNTSREAKLILNTHQMTMPFQKQKLLCV
jgi:hypothetical protein